MQQHVEILDQPEQWRGPFVAAVSLHAGFVLLMVVYNIAGRTQPWGSPDATGGAVLVDAVSSIPLPNRMGSQNPLANQSESQVPQTPVVKPERQVEKEPSSKAERVKLQREKKRLADVAAARQRFRPKEEPQPNQVYSQTAPMVQSPLYAPVPGTGQIGAGPSGSLGVRFAAYEQQLRALVAQKWRTQDVDPRLRNAPAVMIQFELMRDGNIRGVRFLQRSGNPALDASAQRAIYEAAPFPPIPAGFERDSAQVEFTFELRR
jgi:TonB family protein